MKAAGYWVKASERMPPIYKELPVKVTDKTNGVFFDTCRFDGENIGLLRNSGMMLRQSQIEWLSETHPLPDAETERTASLGNTSEAGGEEGTGKTVMQELLDSLIHQSNGCDAGIPNQRHERFILSGIICFAKELLIKEEKQLRDAFNNGIKSTY
jgi:hypothetical protein